MSLRQIRQIGDDILKKKSKNLTEMTDKTKELITDMKDTMKEHGGCGLAAVQVGVLRNIIIVQPSENDPIYTFINPVVVSKSSETNLDLEGCLSVEGKKGRVERPNSVTINYLDEDMNEQTLVAEGFFARAIFHELDHLNGELYTEHLIGRLYNDDENMDDIDNSLNNIKNEDYD